MKRSKVVALVAIGIGPLALAACDRRPECRPGEPPSQDCRPASSAHGGGSARGWWSFGRSSSTDAVATTGGTGGTGESATARGGFGGTGEAAAGGAHGGGEGGGHGGGGGE